ncbi:hypothetical protein SARC_08608 [Sphaeroforma arctica JP610]|uniref:Uncharacterized protein n=1 Tax=Sphaeroforma arctica JP610 TaxID=667725 RepID=A0A0L0FSL7_9EUKA|nr:hypothetical protein SARC_08608 [Sphaeroforma arctica JP610]KNC78978.1 hypothetical protein SARC_08608 [Sphaeroforma arctica JP610]|eukprot:XP_014152880.1 hypothetical protein SARC_08608 [Sphaeroforma arctica JP610]
MKEIAQLSQSLSDMSNDFRKQTDAHHQKYTEVRALEMENADLQRANRALMDRLRTQEHLHETEGANDTESTRQHVQREALLTRRLAEAQEEINNLRLQATRAARRMSPTTTHSKTHTQQSTYTINTDAPANGSPYTHVTESKMHLNIEPPRTMHPIPNYQDRTMHPKPNYQDRTMHPKPNYQDRASASISRALHRKESTVKVARGYSPSPTNDRNTVNDGTYQRDTGDVVQGDRQARTITHTPRNRPPYEHVHEHAHEHEHAVYRPKVHGLDEVHTDRWAPVHTPPPAEAKAHTWTRESQAEGRRDAQAYGTHPRTNGHAPGPQREGQGQGETHGGEHRNSRIDTQAQGNYGRYAYTHSQENGPGPKNQPRAYPRPASATYLTDGRGCSVDEEADEIYSLPTDTRYLSTDAAHARVHIPSEYQHPRGQEGIEHHSVSEPASPLRQLRELRIEDMSQMSANGDFNEQTINTTFSSDGQNGTYTADMRQGRPRRHSRTEVAAHSWDDRGSAEGSEHVWDVVDVSAMDHGDDINTSSARVEQMGNIIDRHIAVLKDKFQQKLDSQR